VGAGESARRSLLGLELLLEGAVLGSEWEKKASAHNERMRRGDECRTNKAVHGATGIQK